MNDYNPLADAAGILAALALFLTLGGWMVERGRHMATTRARRREDLRIRRVME